MSDSSRGKFVKDWGGLVATLVVVLITVSAVILLARGWQREIEYDAARNAANYAADARNDISAKCGNLTAQERDDCEDTINDPARSNQRNEYDLAAQKVMALWTAIMGGMAVVGVGLSGLGFAAIVASLFQIKRDIFLARQSERAIIYFKQSLRKGSDGINVRIENFGNTPANVVGYKWDRWDREGSPTKSEVTNWGARGEFREEDVWLPIKPGDCKVLVKIDVPSEVNRILIAAFYIDAFAEKCRSIAVYERRGQFWHLCPGVSANQLY